MRLRECRGPVWRIEPTFANARFWLVLFLNQFRLFVFDLAMPGPASQSELGTALRVRPSGSLMLNQNDYLLARSQEDGAHSADGPWFSAGP